MGVIGAGRHRVNVTQHQLGKSGEKKTPYVAVQFESQETIGDYITWYGYITDAALERTLASLAILGWNSAEQDGRIESLHNTDLLQGNEAEIVVEMETFEGKERAKVKWVNAVGGGMGEGLSTEEALTMGSVLRQKILSAQKPQPSARPGPARKAAGVGNGKPLSQPDDDLPF